MPRTPIQIAQPLEYLSILDEHGTLDDELEPKIDDRDLLDLYRAMLFGRRFDERLLALQRQGRIGTFPPIKGQEASQLGAVVHLSPTDWFVPSFRETAAEIWRGRSPESVILYYNGYNEGTVIPQQQCDMPMAVPVASQVLHAVGLGYAAGY
ncbi:MAG TPA: thiamine pyrophosphate-dependent enzyme, partial [Desulfopila sp.]|nr:thiamine pyrophosphate-dependent enzyme [Desulfopila sp.]